MIHPIVEKALEALRKDGKKFTEAQVKSVFHEYFRTISQVMNNFTAPAVMMYGLGTIRVATKSAFKVFHNLTEKLEECKTNEERETILEEIEFIEKIIGVGCRYDQSQYLKYTTNKNQPVQDDKIKEI